MIATIPNIALACSEDLDQANGTAAEDRLSLKLHEISTAMAVVTVFWPLLPPDQNDISRATTSPIALLQIDFAIGKEEDPDFRRRSRSNERAY